MRHTANPRRPSRRALHALCALLLLVAPARAHEGPPFPVLVDEPHPPWSISVWADPDVGLGTFYVQLAPAEGHALPEDTRVDVHVTPADGRLPETSWAGDLDRRDRDRQDKAEFEQFEVEVEFPTQEFWLVRIVVASEQADARAENILRVEVTPPGYGPIDILLYVWPFVLLGGLWLKAMLRRRGPPPATAAREGAAVTPPSSPPHTNT